MNKAQIITKIESAWQDLQSSFANLSADQMNEANAAGDWSVKDTLAHVTTWEEECLKFLPVILQGGRPARYKDLYGGIDAFNALMTEKKRKDSQTDILENLESVHQRLMDYLESVPEEHFSHETRFRRRLRLDTYSHYPHHSRLIRSWRGNAAY
ncbi:MAG TPA: DinB family protein [Candidatus Gracilibacteria bacterium]|nr:DinB family protein [Candidatus Gracilibacteria bacterium]